MSMAGAGKPSALRTDEVVELIDAIENRDRRIAHLAAELSRLYQPPPD